MTMPTNQEIISEAKKWSNGDGGIVVNEEIFFPWLTSALDKVREDERKRRKTEKCHTAIEARKAGVLEEQTRIKGIIERIGKYTYLRYCGDECVDKVVSDILTSISKEEK